MYGKSFGLAIQWYENTKKQKKYRLQIFLKTLFMISKWLPAFDVWRRPNIFIRGLDFTMSHRRIEIVNSLFQGFRLPNCDSNGKNQNERFQKSFHFFFLSNNLVAWFLPTKYNEMSILVSMTSEVKSPSLLLSVLMLSVFYKLDINRLNYES